MKQVLNSGFDSNTKNYTEATEKENMNSNKYGSRFDSRKKRVWY